MDNSGRFPFASGSRVTKRTRGYLPHWEQEGGIYFVTYHLGDSLPASVRARIAQRKAALEAARRSGRKLVPMESVLAHELSSRKIEAYLDAGYGECVLRRPECAGVVAESLGFYEGQRYEFEAWCIMPNHVHAVFQPLRGYGLARIVGRWKWLTARRINAILKRRGRLWQREYYDHLIRDEAELARAVEYVRKNPERAGLKEWPWVYVKERWRE
jgi:REP element-mobilizing transposase RayT